MQLTGGNCALLFNMSQTEGFSVVHGDHRSTMPIEKKMGLTPQLRHQPRPIKGNLPLFYA